MHKKILITGGSGLIGQSLTALLSDKGYEVAHLSRQGDLTKPVKAYEWDYKSDKINEDALTQCHAVIHLAGAGIADKRWTAQRKQEIIDSRVKTAELLYNGFDKIGHWPEVFISASGINYYGSVTVDHVFTEIDPPAPSFIGECCVLWEAAAQKFETHSRVAVLRTGVVLSAKGGALPKIDAPVKYGFGAALGSGQQWMPYLHLHDLCAMYLYALENGHIHGPYNATNGDGITNAQLTKAIAAALGKPLWLPNVPGFVLKLALGEMAELLLEGSRASNEKIVGEGFEFKFPHLQGALQDIYSHS